MAKVNVYADHSHIQTDRSKTRCPELPPMLPSMSIQTHELGRSIYPLFNLDKWKWRSRSISLSLKERGGGQNFSTSFWMWFSQAPLCRYRFKFIFDDIIFLLSGNIIEYICFWRFNSIIMTWNKWLVFTKSVIMGLNNISHWPCPLGFVCLPCVITWLYSTPWLFMRSVGVVVCLSLRMAKVTGSRRTQYSVVSVIFIAIIVLYFLLSFSRNG